MFLGSQRHATGVLPTGKTRYPLYRSLRWPQGRSGNVQKNLAPLGYDLWTVQPVASRNKTQILLQILTLE